MYNYEDNGKLLKQRYEQKIDEDRTNMKKKLASAIVGLSPSENPSGVNEPNSFEEHQAKVVDCERLNIRAKPDFSAPIIATLTEGSRITITGVPNAKFYSIRTAAGILGYCSQNFVKYL